MDDQRVGRVVRALRRRRGWRQVDLARAAGCSQGMVSLIERGHIDSVSLHRVRAVLSALDARAVVQVSWRAGDLDRLLDEDSTVVVATLTGQLRRAGWLVETEVTYSRYRERGSYDVLAFHPGTGIVLVVEVKTDLPSAEAMLRKLDEKVRLAPAITRERFGWHARADGPPARDAGRAHAAPAGRAPSRLVRRRLPGAVGGRAAMDRGARWRHVRPLVPDSHESR